MENNLWVSMPIIRNIILGAAHNKHQIEMICAAGGIEPEWLNMGDRKINLAQNCAIMEAAIHLSEDASFGLHIGERTTPVVLGITGHLMESSADVLAALKHLQDFTSAITRLYTFSLEANGEELYYYCEPIEIWNQISPETARQSVDIAFSGVVNFTRLLTGKTIYPKKVTYRYQRPSAPTEHVQILKVQPLFKQANNCIVFNLADMQAPLIGFNNQLNEILKNLLETELKKSIENASFSGELKQVILKQYQFDIPQLEEVAAMMNITPRTLQRKLMDESTSFRKLSESIRHELALELLNNNRLTVAEIAYMLGYTEASAFQRAFKQWTQTSPQAYRNEKAS